ncbi:peptide ABC transporter substrate-binding protein [Sphaerotilus mobilis]|uniref:Peptide/nickel transport system substrate-binding protein n=1 Tax=Sphaerotilus mobilis TaxID=47994 RepID=A0A4Q7LH43_9BURK|nr:peptide ABC transporter substrate-binding protein [Sphaerotilus mobilis]RZS53391.1 peptide/nickel transport system substrate-binding protein [Sphaerotilus mobilis]
MREADIRAAIQAVRSGALSRRAFIARLTAVGLPGPMAAALLPMSDAAGAQTGKPFYEPVRRGGGGALRMLFWQGPTLLNPHFASGSKDQAACRLFYEPLVDWDRDGNLYPMLAQEVPSLANGGLARDGRSVTWKLKPDVTWHDGKPFTADDVVATWEYARDPATAAITHGSFRSIQVRKVDALTVRHEFDRPTPFWVDAALHCVLPRHLFAAFRGATSRDAPANSRPVGTGPYRFVDMVPGDLVRGELNPTYHQPLKPHFDTVTIKGGGDALSAARAVLQTGEYDFAWNLQIEDEILRRLEEGGRGTLDFAHGGHVEFLMLNHADPWSEVDGERASPASRHPVLLDPAVREALALLVDRDSIQRFLYGRGGVGTANFLVNPARYTSTRKGLGHDPARAEALLEAAGWKRGPDGVRQRDGKRLKFLFQTSVNATRQKVQGLLRQAAQRVGIELELKSTTASVFFSSDPGSQDTATKFLADLQMYQQGRNGPDPGRFMEMFCSWQIASRENKWEGRNVIRWRHERYDRTFRAAEVEVDPVRRAALLIELNDLVCEDGAIVPIVYRPAISALTRRLRAPISGWTVETAQIADWFKA